MTPSGRDWAHLVRIHRRGGNRVRLPDEAGVADVARLFVERAIDEYEFTPAERCVAARLGLGECPAAVAIARGVSEHTIRTQLRAVYASADVSDHGELSADMLKRVAWIAAELYVQLRVLQSSMRERSSDSSRETIAHQEPTSSLPASGRASMECAVCPSPK